MTEPKPDVGGIFVLSMVNYPAALLSFEGIADNVQVDDMANRSFDQQWEQWQDTIGREYKITAVRDLADRLHLESATLVPNTEGRILLAQAEDHACAILVRRALDVAGDSFRLLDGRGITPAEQLADLEALREASIAHVRAMTRRRSPDPLEDDDA